MHFSFHLIFKVISTGSVYKVRREFGFYQNPTFIHDIFYQNYIGKH